MRRLGPAAGGEPALRAAGTRYRRPWPRFEHAPVTIISVQTSCGCTSAALARTDYAPGEGGELNVTYRFEGQVGPHGPRQKGNPTEKCSVPMGSPVRGFRLRPYSSRTGPISVWYRRPTPAE